MSFEVDDLGDLLLACRSAHEQLVQAAAQSADEDERELARGAAQRLEASVLRPLVRAVGGERGETRPAEEPLALRELAIRATTLRARASAPRPSCWRPRPRCRLWRWALPSEGVRRRMRL